MTKDSKKMDEAYYNLKRKLEELGYNNTLPVDAVPLVECILADLLQTTRSLQHYMDLSKEALIQRDSLTLQAEPYKCENSKLIKENNQLHREIMQLKEENLKISKESTRKIKSLSEELSKKDLLISKLKHDIRDLSLRGLCAGTSSSRSKSKRKDGDDYVPKICICKNEKSSEADKDIGEIKKKMDLLQETNDAYYDEILLLKSQVEHRDNEIIRLNILLEGGRPLAAISRECCNITSETKYQELLKKFHEMERTNDLLKKEIENGLEKQHEAMVRALSLADKNKSLQEELKKVDTLALKVEDDCNKRVAALMNDVNFLQKRIEGLTMKNTHLEKELSYQSIKESSPHMYKLQESLNLALKEKDTLQKEIKDLVEINKNLQDKIVSLSQVSVNYQCDKDDTEHSKNCPSKDEMQKLLQDERKKYEQHVFTIQEKLNEALSLFNNTLKKSNEKTPTSTYRNYDSTMLKDLQNKLCVSEQKILMLKKENDELKARVYNQEHNSKQNYKDVISQLNTENSELSKENILLSQQLSQYKNLNCSKYNDRGDYYRHDIERLKNEIEKLTQESQLLRKDKHEYNIRYKEAVNMVEKLKRDLAFKQKEVEKLEEENCSYKMTNRTDKASADHLRDECDFLREQMKRMQNDFIKEKTLASQIKNIQLETERSSTEIQNELLAMQKKLSLCKDNTEMLEKKIRDLQAEIISLKNDKSNLIDNIKKIDQERDKMVIDLDHKTENISLLNQKLKSQTYEISKLENEITELNRQLNTNRVSEHKLVDNEAQIKFLNGEISRLSQQFENAMMENKQLQNSLADANGNLKVTKIELEKSRKDVDGLKQQLQHYVAEIRRIEEMLSHKEAERSDMLEQFASLSVEANILENTNHSLESESASKSLQLQSYVSKIQSLESQLLDKDTIIDKQSTRIASFTCKISSLDNEVKLLREEKSILEQNVTYLKQMCNNLQSEHANISRGVNNTDSELKLYENRIKNLLSTKAKLELDKNALQTKIATMESLLSNARREIVELKLAIQDATSETRTLHDRVNSLSKHETLIHETTLTNDELELPLMLDDTIHEEDLNNDDSL